MFLLDWNPTFESNPKELFERDPVAPIRSLPLDSFGFIHLSKEPDSHANRSFPAVKTTGFWNLKMEQQKVLYSL